MKQPREKTKIVTETSNIRKLLRESSVLIAEKEGDSIKEPYETPKMVTKTIDEGIGTYILG